MDQAPPIATSFCLLRDPRVRGRCEHQLIPIVIMALCAVIAGCNDWQQIAVFARERLDWFRRFLPIREGLNAPSHDTFERLFSRLNPTVFHSCFQHWVKTITARLGIPHIAIDGKTLRGSGDVSADLGPLHLVSAWATGVSLSLGQVAVNGKSNEITAIPKLLEFLDLKGAFVTIDAMGCQKEIAAQVKGQGGEYVLAVKGNQPRLLEDVQTTLEVAMDADDGPGVCEILTTEEQGHGRKESRLYVVANRTEDIRDRALWPGLTSVGMCVCRREVGGVASEETRYFISSAALSAKGSAEVTRSHWSIENKLHWQLDVTFREDENGVTDRHGAENLGLLRRLALSLLKQETAKLSLACKRLRAGLSTEYLECVLKSADNLGKV